MESEKSGFFKEMSEIWRKMQVNSVFSWYLVVTFNHPNFLSYALKNIKHHLFEF